MPIVETKVMSRSSTSVPFFSEATEYTTSVRPVVMSGIQSYIDSGAFVNAYSISSDQLTQTLTQTYADLETYSAVDTKLSITLDAAHYEYAITNGLTAVTYTQTGIDVPFTQTITYSIPANSELTANIEYAISTLNQTFTTSVNTKKLSNLEVNTNSVTAVLTFNDSADFTNNFVKDNHLAPLLQSVNGTRTISYATVTST